MDSAARESSDLESVPTPSGSVQICCFVHMHFASNDFSLVLPASLPCTAPQSHRIDPLMCCVSHGGSRSSWCCCSRAARSAPVRCMKACWHFCTLAFAEHPIRRHKEWLGVILPCPAGDVDADRDGRGGEPSSCDARAGGGGAAKRRLPFGCLDGSEPGAKKCAAPPAPSSHLPPSYNCEGCVKWHCHNLQACKTSPVLLSICCQMSVQEQQLRFSRAHGTWSWGAPGQVELHDQRHARPSRLI